MATIQGTHGAVNVTLIGVADVAKMLYEVTKDIEILTSEETLRAGAFAAFEVQASILGQRAEPRSVDTGRFANSIQVQPVGKNSVSVFTDVEYAKFLEYGTIHMQARQHFQNTAFRIEPNLKEEFNAEVTKICDKANK